MSYQEEEKTKLRRQSSKQAIALAMEGRWQEAVEANKGLIENFPNDVDSYNRLGRAYMELGEYALAREAYEKSLQIDPYNTIAQKNLNRLAHVGETAAGADGAHKVEPQHFIEEVGKAGIVKLQRLAPPSVLAKMVAGDVVNLKIEGANLIVENNRGEHLGQVETRHGQRLVKLMEGGNKYTAAIINATAGAATVIIREVYKDPSQAGELSFPPKTFETFRPSVADRIIRREIEYEESLPGEPAYTMISGEIGEEGEELLPEESSEAEEEEEE
ncbi:MAG: tetratricopeptide repeat protein [Chloroflexi bacterium]|nr:tetratricopeptide repeat protein [Chloroflexota bacterium]